jgi:hypothetical protein
MDENWMTPGNRMPLRQTTIAAAKYATAPQASHKKIDDASRLLVPLALALIDA